MNYFQRDNLLLLAQYLDGLSKEYQEAHFNMSYFVKNGVVSREVDPSEVSNVDIFACGSCACAIGHGPYAGIPVVESDVHWDDYSMRVFGLAQDDDNTSEEWEHLFGYDNKNDAQAAAARIRKYVENTRVIG